MPLSTTQQICALLHTQSRKITAQFIAMQMQTNSSDCGVFSIACAVALCHGLDPATLRWDIARMRPHLVQCFENKEMVPFPLKEVIPKPIKPIKHFQRIKVLG